jgi:hypothetical protein
MAFLFEHDCPCVRDTREELFTHDGHIRWWSGWEKGEYPLLVLKYHGFDEFDSYEFVGGRWPEWL